MVNYWERMEYRNDYVGTVQDFMAEVPTAPEVLERDLLLFRDIGLLDQRGIEETRRAIKRVWDGTSEAFSRGT